MDFTLDETQQVIARIAGEVLDPLEAGNTDADDAAFDQAAWKALGQAGLLALAVPTWLGGDGLGPLETAVLLTEVGRRAARVPALAALALGVLPVARWGSREQQEALLARDGVPLTAALREPSAPMPARPATTAPGSMTAASATVTSCSTIAPVLTSAP